jgi:hypothetical protein
MYHRDLETNAVAKAEWNRDQKATALARRDAHRAWNAKHKEKPIKEKSNG